MIPESVAIEERGSAEVTLRLLARLTVVASVQTKWILGISVQGDLRILLVEEAFAVESLLSGGIPCWSERADGSQADRNGKRNQPESMDGTGEGHWPALSHHVVPVSSVAGTMPPAAARGRGRVPRLGRAPVQRGVSLHAAWNDT
jgi:hypothetical protein